MSPEVFTQISSENLGQTIRRPIASFVRIDPRISLNPDIIRAYVGSELMVRNSPYFNSGDICPLDSYLLGRTDDPSEVAEEIGTLGYRAIKNLEAFDPYALPRFRRIISTSKISTDTEEREKDLKLLMSADVTIGNAVRRLQTSMTKEGEDFRDETHKLIGDPTDRFDYSLSSKSETLILPHTTDIQRQINVQKQPLNDVLQRLPMHLQRGYNFFADLLKPIFAAPVERAYLLTLRTPKRF